MKQQPALHQFELSLFLSTGPFFLVWAVVNSVAWAYGTTQALPVGTIILVMCLWMFGKSFTSILISTIIVTFSSTFTATITATFISTNTVTLYFNIYCNIGSTFTTTINATMLFVTIERLTNSVILLKACSRNLHNNILKKSPQALVSHIVHFANSACFQWNI